MGFWWLPTAWATAASSRVQFQVVGVGWTSAHVVPVSHRRTEPTTALEGR